MGIEVYIYI